jgi:hypothetical protein
MSRKQLFHGVRLRSGGHQVGYLGHRVCPGSVPSAFPKMLNVTGSVFDMLAKATGLLDCTVHIVDPDCKGTNT